MHVVIGQSNLKNLQWENGDLFSFKDYILLGYLWYF
jgi:hypothetical protein